MNPSLHSLLPGPVGQRQTDLRADLGLVVRIRLEQNLHQISERGHHGVYLLSRTVRFEIQPPGTGPIEPGPGRFVIDGAYRFVIP